MKKIFTKKGTVVSLIALGGIALIVVAFIFLGEPQNQAKQAVDPIEYQLQKMGARKICVNGDPGHSFNTVPWYDAYYEVEDSSTLTHEIKSIAHAEGYTLSEDTEFINDLKGLRRADGSIVTPYGDEKYNDSTDYLTATSNGNTLKIVVYRDASVALYCSGSNYGGHKDTAGGAIIRLNISLPSTR